MADMQIVVASDTDTNSVEAQYVEMMVPLYSYGCERKVKKALSHLKGIYSVNVDFRQQKVTVWGICNKSDVLSAVKSKRKRAGFWDGREDPPKQDGVVQVCQNDQQPSAPSSPQSPPIYRAPWRSWSFSRYHVDPMALVKIRLIED